MQKREDLLAPNNMVKALANQLHSIEVKIKDDVYMVLFMSLPPSFDNLVMSLESISTKDVDLQFIVIQLLRCESKKNVALFNKTHKANKKFCFYFKNPNIYEEC
jgi:hypothetical protein